MNEEELNSMKYRALQNLAKEHGVKANLRKDAIIPAILAAAISKIAPKEIENTPEISNVVTAESSTGSHRPSSPKPAKKFISLQKIMPRGKKSSKSDVSTGKVKKMTEASTGSNSKIDELEIEDDLKAREQNGDEASKQVKQPRVCFNENEEYDSFNEIDRSKKNSSTNFPILKSILKDHYDNIKDYITPEERTSQNAEINRKVGEVAENLLKLGINSRSRRPKTRSTQARRNDLDAKVMAYINKGLD